MDSVDSPSSPFACSECKTRKVKCDKTKPTCHRCIKDGAGCHYPTARKRPPPLPSRPQVQEMENRLVELENQLSQKEAMERQLLLNLDTVRAGTELVGTGRYEQLPPQWQIETLTNLYFEKLHPEMPMVHPSRYLASLYQPPHMQPPMCLQYIIMALAAGAAVAYKELADPFYRRSRYYIEADEMKEDGYHVTLAHCQCWALIGAYEAQNLLFARGSMSTSRAVRLSQVLGIHLLDGPGAVNPSMPPPRDWVEMEERRRTFWAVFYLDRGTSSSATWPVLIDVTTRLPASEEAYQSSIEEPSITLPEALTYDSQPRSAFACRVVAIHLLRECLDLTQSHHHHHSAALSDPAAKDSIFWGRFNQLDSSLLVAFATLPEALRCPCNAHDSNAVLVNLQLHTATIALYRAAVAVSHSYTPYSQQAAHQQDEASSTIARIEAMIHPAAQVIVTTIALAKDINTRFRNPFVAFAGFMAASVFLKEYMSTGNEESVHKLTALLDVMVAVGKESPRSFPSTLAVQLAQELDRTGVDPTAMHKVRPLVDKMDVSTPVLGKEDGGTGMVILCPFEQPVESRPQTMDG
ncbi:Lactose regulatory protein-like protein [Hapsidospora chrysogenum ATCC 11550]|uniref:Lactose regulatory protein-like protein n=1 Tax=Hapsidospora chrysogenum (strain ATCC 11550 / CBS 779.69 / DSM 880 / IAM 14645 / JCM 23072 / IMI 49137) TaxID=857340 RepID=A0A086TB46_HAPC1|nr:Lactose regulatory protein-like protein [Hapsidospora chrysogenum ATCC 11550]